jgi:predicted alpha-1,6-mannanase (GH76 family)
MTRAPRLAALACLGASLAAPAAAFGPADATSLFDAYHRAFYVGDGGTAHFKGDTSGGVSPFWAQAEELEMVIDAYERTRSPRTRDTITALAKGFLAQHGPDWTWNVYNDDIAWAVIAFARAYRATGDAAFRDRARANFDAMFARAADSALGGGLWWTTGRTSKNACVNGPAAIAAHLLFRITGDIAYQARSRALYDWERRTLFDPATGAVHDSISASGTVTTRVFSYNLGTFIGAANFQARTADAARAADYAMNTLAGGRLLPAQDEAGDGGGFNGIFLRWMARFMKDRGLQATYLAWLQLNADAAWRVRRADGLSWCFWNSPTPPGTRPSFGGGLGDRLAGGAGGWSRREDRAHGTARLPAIRFAWRTARGVWPAARVDSGAWRGVSEAADVLCEHIQVDRLQVNAPQGTENVGLGKHHACENHDSQADHLRVRPDVEHQAASSRSMNLDDEDVRQALLQHLGRCRGVRRHRHLEAEEHAKGLGEALPRIRIVLHDEHTYRQGHASP